MPDSILVLRLEHRKIGKVLRLLKHQLAQMQAGLPVDRLLLESAMDYLSGFPDQCHHPKEDLVYRKLLDRHPALAGSLKDLDAEHEEISHLTRQLRQALSDARLQTVEADKALAQRLQDFLEFYFLHMLMEEQHFFPMALHHLSRTDFDEIDFLLYEQLDSKLSQETEAGFADLLKAIVDVGNLDNDDFKFHEEAARLAAITGIDSFHAILIRHGDPAKLNRSSGGGYTLVRDGVLLLRIPACGETQAAWCAYYFLKGAALATIGESDGAAH
jgi:hemerythrin-like domain-containing protein